MWVSEKRTPSFFREDEKQEKKQKGRGIQFRRDFALLASIVMTLPPPPLVVSR